MTSRRGLLVAILAAIIFWPAGGFAQGLFKAAGEGTVRALVIGINDYENFATLKGAVADANDIGNALRSAGVTNVTMLIDKQASRRAIEAAMNKLIAESKAGDLALISYAGHGAQQPELVKGSESDGMDEIFVLGGFSRSGPGTAERIVDNEVNAWLQALDKKGVQVLFVADSCHGGGMTRGVDERVGELSFRTAGTITVTDDELKPISTQADAFLNVEMFKNVTFLSAVDKFSKSPELRIPGNPTLRGALSYAVARAIEGSIEGNVTRRDLFGNVRQLVYQYSESRQNIVTEPKDNAVLDTVVFRATVAGAGEEGAQEPVKIKIINGGKDVLRDVVSRRASFQVVAESEAADLVWDAGKSEMLSGSGDVIASSLTVQDIPAIVDAAAVLASVSKLAEKGAHPVVLRPEGKRHHNGDEVEFEIEDTAGRYMILFNITGDGTVQFLYPRQGDNAAAPILQKSFRLPLKVEAPFGSDHVVAIMLPRRAQTIEQALLRLDGKKAAGDILRILRPLRKSEAQVKIGSAGLFTAP